MANSTFSISFPTFFKSPILFGTSQSMCRKLEQGARARLAAGRGAHKPDAASVKLHDLLHEAQSQTRALAARVRTLERKKLVEHLRAGELRNARPLVFDAQLDPVAL